MGEARNQVDNPANAEDGLCLNGRLEIAAAYPTLQQPRDSLFQRPPNSEARQKAQSSSSISQLIGVGGGNERGMVWRLRTNQTLRAAVSHPPPRTDACFLVGCSTIHDTGQGQGWRQDYEGAQGIFLPSSGAQAKTSLIAGSRTASTQPGEIRASVTASF